MILGDHVVTVLRAPVQEDAYGNEKADWSSAISRTVTGCSVQPLTGEEVTIGRETVVSRWRIRAPFDADLLSTDRVQYDGETFEVDGQVQRWDFPPLSHLSALLRKGDA